MKWLRDDERESWPSFCQQMLLLYGFRRKRMEGILKEAYPMIRINEEGMPVPARTPEDDSKGDPDGGGGEEAKSHTTS